VKFNEEEAVISVEFNESTSVINAYFGENIKIEKDDTVTYLLVTEDGQEIPAVLVDEETVFTATANDIRIGTVAATSAGVTEGTKFIPTYITQEGRARIAPGKPLAINMFSDMCEYTKLQAIVCAYNTSITNSVAAEMVVVNDSLYDVHSIIEKASVTVDTEKQTINLGVTNDSNDYLVIRYFTYKED
jgi:hypothetical protein